MPVQEVQECVEGDAVMTCYEKYKAAQDKDDLLDMIKDDAIVAVFLGNNQDRIKAIEDAGNKVAREKGWDLHE